MSQKSNMGEDVPKKPVVLGQFKVQKNRKSKYVCLPAAWAVINGVKPGDYIEFSIGEGGTLCARKVVVDAPPALKQGGGEVVA